MMERMTEIQKALANAKLEEVAIELGVSYWTLLRYKRGTVKNPPADVYMALIRWIDKNAS